MATDDKSKTVREELARKNIDMSVKKLAFDPTTGELVIKNETDLAQAPGEIVIDQIYKDGFFGHS